MSTKYQNIAYRDAYFGTFKYNRFDVLQLEINRTKATDTKNKTAFVLENEDYMYGDPNYYYNNWTKYNSYCSKKAGPNLYFRDGCKTPRSLFRDSGYKIVLDPERADTIVVPTMQNPCSTFQCLVVCMKNGDLFMFSNCFYYHSLTAFESKAEQQRVENDLKTNGFTVIKSYEYSHNCYFYDNLDSFAEVLTSEPSPNKFIQEDSIPITTPVKISVDVLDLWRRCDDYEILDKAICASDWKDYPFTLKMLLTKFKMQFISSYNRSSYFRTILKTIDINSNSIAGKLVTPKDWNMWQDFCLHLCNLPPEGGIAELRGIPVEIQPFVQIRSAVRPTHITEPQALDVLIQNA